MEMDIKVAGTNTNIFTLIRENRRLSYDQLTSLKEIHGYKWSPKALEDFQVYSNGNKNIYWPQINKNKLNKFYFSFISIFCATLWTACTSTMFSDFELILKWLIGIYVVFKIFSWLGKGGSGGGGNSGSSCGAD